MMTLAAIFKPPHPKMFSRSARVTDEVDPPNYGSCPGPEEGRERRVCWSINLRDGLNDKASSLHLAGVKVVSFA